LIHGFLGLSIKPIIKNLIIKHFSPPKIKTNQILPRTPYKKTASPYQVSGFLFYNFSRLKGNPLCEFTT
jgi:hypothetical protein